MQGIIIMGMVSKISIRLFIYLFVSTGLYSLGISDKQTNTILIPQNFIENNFEIILGSRIDRNTLIYYHYEPSTGMYHSVLSSENTYFTSISLELSRNRKLLFIEFESGGFNKDEYLRNDSRIDEIINLCNQYYGEATIRQRGINIDSQSPLAIVLNNMVIYEWRTGSFRVEFIFLQKERYFELNEKIPIDFHFWYLLRYFYEP